MSRGERRFTGSNVDGLSTLKYLYREHPQQCTFVLEKALQAPRELGIWSQVAFVWMKQRLTVPGGSITAISLEVDRCEYSLTVAPLLLVSTNGRHLHINILVLDREEGTAELFEPYGRMPPIYGDAKPLEAALMTQLGQVIPEVRLVRPMLSEGKGLQARQELEGKMRVGKGLPPGYCMAWSALYAKVRLSSPLEQRELIPDKLLSMAQDETAAASMTEFIQAFARELISGDSSS